MSAIPVYELYGELLAGNYSDPIHFEPIRERSQYHDWTIRLHRHKGLAQIFLFRTLGVSVSLGEVAHTSTEPMLCFAPCGVPHGFKFSEDVNGDVLSLRLDTVGEAVMDQLDRAIMQPGALILQSRSAHFEKLVQVFDQLGAAYHGFEPERQGILNALTQLIVTYVCADLRRATSVGRPAPAMSLTRHEELAEGFCALVEQRFAEQLNVEGFAAQLGVSAPHLSRICRQVLDASPNDLVRRRRMLEARRLLEYTRLPISEIAYRSGFRDPAFFSRSFRSAVGMAPKSYRESRES